MDRQIIRFPVERTTRNPKRRTPGTVVPFLGSVPALTELTLSIAQAAPNAPKSVY
jgi:hypothetical protein